MMKDSIIILCGGGPAPGMNSVSMSVAKTFLSKGYRVIGLHGGYSGLFSRNARIEDIDFLKADRYFNRGGSYLEMSRFKPTDKDFEENFNLDLFKDNNIKLLVTIGGDDTASTANRISKFLASKHYPIANIHCPKTIDNDLPLPDNTPTFGYNSAKNEGAHLARTIYEDAYIFAPNLHAMGLMTTRDFENYFSLFELMNSFIQAPDLLVYLRAEVPTLVRQIQLRGREYESGIRLDYLKSLNDRYEDWISHYDQGKLLVVDVNELDFRNKPEDLGAVIEQVDAQINGLF